MTEFSDIDELVIASDSFEYGGKHFQVWGLTPAYIVAIVRAQGDALAPLFAEAVQGNLPADLTALTRRVDLDWAKIAGQVIACGCRRPDSIEKLSGLPTDKQVEAVDKIIRLTVGGPDGLGKLVEIVTRALSDMASLRSPT